jgi:EAL domain-containing protein (putative c-di-GMP-specific phosphodiesterase class I)
VRESLDRLDKLGVAVVLDDFGAGYSSLSYLMRFSVTGLKIDRSFIAGVLDRQEARAVVAASISLGKSLGLDVVAEGVETQEQMDYLRDHGCPFVQGILLAEPLTSDAFVRLLRGELEAGDPTGLTSVESSKA